MTSMLKSMMATGAMRHRVLTKKGLRLCLMLVGRGSVGKSTFINTLCGKDALPVDVCDPKDDGSEMRLIPHRVEMRDGEDNVVINLDVIETSGFGDMVNNEDCDDVIVSYLEARFDELLTARSRVNRDPKFSDTCVHVALYFIEPTGHGLQQLDIDTMIAMSACVNVIPVIAKADTLTKSEIAENKQLIMRDIRRFKIKIFDFPYDEGDDEAREQCEELKALLPFAIIGAKGRGRSREYPWGTFDPENTELCDFAILKSVLFGSHFEELRDITYNKHYETYRTAKLSQEERERQRLSADACLRDNIFESNSNLRSDVGSTYAPYGANSGVEVRVMPENDHIKKPSKRYASGADPESALERNDFWHGRSGQKLGRVAEE